ncbi:MAG: hypothetical protein NDI94_03795 [Candidatus Woesearchaeota archaeon]|nr:hypothetical protein [Candidatus Woesearchaeota archaeon]
MGKMRLLQNSKGIGKIRVFPYQECIRKIIRGMSPTQKMKKIGIFFSITSLLIVILFIAISNMFSNTTLKENDLDVTRAKVKAMNSIVQEMENNYFDKIIYVSSKNALIGLSKYYRKDSYLNTVLKRPLINNLQNLIQNGTIMESNGNMIDLKKINCMGSPCITKKYVMADLKPEIETVFSDLGMNVHEFKVNITDVSQKDPWTIEIKADVSYFFEDKERIISWKSISPRIVDIPVYGLYAFDYESGSKGNFGVITTAWKEDKGSRTEPSIVNKMSTHDHGAGYLGRGICSPDFNVGGKTCETD